MIPYHIMFLRQSLSELRLIERHIFRNEGDVISLTQDMVRVIQEIKERTGSLIEGVTDQLLHSEEAFLEACLRLDEGLAEKGLESELILTDLVEWVRSRMVEQGIFPMTAGKDAYADAQIGAVESSVSDTLIPWQGTQVQFALVIEAVYRAYVGNTKDSGGNDLDPMTKEAYRERMASAFRIGGDGINVGTLRSALQEREKRIGEVRKVMLEEFKEPGANVPKGS